MYERATGLGLTQLGLIDLWKRGRMEEAEETAWLVSLWLDTLILTNLAWIQAAVTQRAWQRDTLPGGQ